MGQVTWEGGAALGAPAPLRGLWHGVAEARTLATRLLESPVPYSDGLLTAIAPSPSPHSVGPLGTCCLSWDGLWI